MSGPDDYPAGRSLPISCCSELKINVVGVEECRYDSSTRTLLKLLARKDISTVHSEGCQKAFRAFLGRKVGVIGAFSVAHFQHFFYFPIFQEQYLSWQL